jgi:PKD repeat protein
MSTECVLGDTYNSSQLIFALQNSVDNAIFFNGTFVVTDNVTLTGSTTVMITGVTENITPIPTSTPAPPPQPNPVQPVPTPTPIQPTVTTSIQPSPIQTTPIQPSPIQTAPIQSSPIQTAPIQPTPVQTAPIQPIVTASFTSGIATGYNRLSVKYQDTSVNSASWLWTLGDGSISIVKNPAHTYSKAGEYTVTLTVKDKIAAIPVLINTVFIYPYFSGFRLLLKLA